MARLENSEIAAMFVEMADLLQIQGGDRHRVASFRRSARIIEGLPRPVQELIDLGEFSKVKGIGKGTVHRVKQMLRRQTCDDLDTLRKAIPVGLRELLKIKGLGPGMVRTIHNRLGVESLEQLEYAAKSGAIESIPRLGLSHAHKILAGIEAYRRRRGKIPLIAAQQVGRRLVASLRELPQAKRVEQAGSVRRGKAAIGDLDILVASTDPGPVAARFQTLPEVEEVLIRGDTRSSVRLKNQQQADLRVLSPATFGAGLHYFTGSKLHNVEIRKRAGLMGLKVSDKGVFTRGDEELIDGCVEEEAVFHHLGLPWIPPELRENQGEIEAAERGRLPRLITDADLRGDLHMHTTDSDGRGSLAEMAERGRELGHEYIAITDHSKALAIANGLDDRRLAEQMARVRRFDERFDGLRVLSGIEVDILRDGSLDLDPALLAQLDWVVASVHQWTNMGAEAMTKRVVRAIESGVVDCIGHPTGRRPGKRDPYAMDIEVIIAAAREYDVALEVNGGPNRMDLPEVECRRCRERGVSVAISTDAHSPRHLGRHEYGLAMARRGWVERGQVANAQPWQVLAERRARRLRDHGDRGWRVSPIPAQVPEGFVVEAEGVGEAGRVVEGEADDHAWGDLEPLPEAIAAPGAPDAPREISDEERTLGEALQHPPVSDALRERIVAWLTSGGGDDPLERALGLLGDNPLQIAFGLVYGGPEDDSPDA